MGAIASSGCAGRFQWQGASHTNETNTCGRSDPLNPIGECEYNALSGLMTIQYLRRRGRTTPPWGRERCERSWQRRSTPRSPEL